MAWLRISTLVYLLLVRYTKIDQRITIFNLYKSELNVSCSCLDWHKQFTMVDFLFSQWFLTWKFFILIWRYKNMSRIWKFYLLSRFVEISKLTALCFPFALPASQPFCLDKMFKISQYNWVLNTWQGRVSVCTVSMETDVYIKLKI